MLKHLLFAALFALTLPLCAQTPEYKAMQYSGYINRFYTLCFDTANMLWVGGRPNGLPYGLPNGVLLHRADANLGPATGRGFNAEPGIEYYTSEIGWDAGGRIIGCGNYQDGGFGKGFVFRFRPLNINSQLLFLKKIEGGEVRLSGQIENTADTSLLVYGTSLEGGVQRGELFRFQRNTGALRPGFPKRYSVGQGLSFDAAILHQGRLYTAGAYSLGSNSTTFGLACLDAASGEPLWFSSNPVATGQPMHLEARDLIFTDDDGDALLIVGSGDDQHSPAQGSHIFLQKSRLDGTLMWVKKIDLPDWTDEYAEEVVAVSDGYLVFGRSRNPAQQGVFLLKTDLSGKPLWAKRINRGLETGLPDWPAQAQMLVRNEAIYLSCNAQVTVNTLSPPNVGLLLKLHLDGTLANCSMVQPTPAVNLPFGNLASVELGLSAAASPLQVSTITASVMGSGGTFSPATICQQTGYLCNDRPDLTASVDSLTCLSAGVYAANVSVCNLGKVASDTGFHLTFYDKNPLVGGAVALQSVFLEEKPAPGACVQTLVPLDAALLQQAQVFTLVGADGNVPTPVSLSDFPLAGGFAECDYANNLDSFEVKKPDCGSGGGDCGNAQTFIKKLGSRQDSDLAFSMCNTADGNIYLAGRKNPVDLVIIKMTPNGEAIWMRKIPAGAAINNLRISEIIEDSDGKIVFSATQGTTPNTYNTIGMRYDPVGDTLIWFKFFGSARPASTGILEKGPGGNFLLSTYAQVNSTGRVYTRIWEVGRNTGETVPGAITSDYEGGSIVRFERLLARQNSLYATGARQQSSGGPTQSMLTKLSALTGDVEWTRATNPDSTASGQPDVLHTDLEFDGDFGLMAGSGLRNAADPAQGVFAYLEKHAPDGSLLWLKRYEVSMRPEDVLALPDAYIIFGKMADNRWGLLKTDKEGNPLIFKTLNTSTASLGNTLLSNRQGQIVRTSDHLIMTDHSPMTDDPNAILLIKTDFDLGLEDACDLLQTELVAATTMPAKSTLVSLTWKKFAASISDAGVIFEKDSTEVCGICPACPCCAPDLTLRVDSITCLSPGAYAASVSVCNLGEMAPDTGFYLTFYDKNPLLGGAVALQSVFLDEKPTPGGCVQAVVPLGAALLQHPQLYTLVGVDGNVPTPISLNSFPFPQGFAECGYVNNLDSFEVVLSPDCVPDPDPDPCHPSTFLKTIGEPGKLENISALRATPDGNLYLAGLKDTRTAIAKMTPDGEFLWTRSFVTDPYESIIIAEIIVDSEGMIVGCGRQGTQSVAKGFAFRYDPGANQMLWAQQIDSNRPREGGILEKTPGGNYLLYQSPNLPDTTQQSELLELDRATGQIVPGFAKRYGLGNLSQSLSAMVAHNGALYGTGYVVAFGHRRALSVKIDANTGDILWARTAHHGWAKPSYFHATDLIVDDDALLTVYFGNENNSSIAGVSTQIYLQKSVLQDGEVIWRKKYNTTGYPKEIVAVPDGYVILIFGGNYDRRLLKTDKNGNVLAFNRIDNPPANFFINGEQQNQIEQIGSRLFIADYATTSLGDQYTTLLKTNLNLELEFGCSNYTSLQFPEDSTSIGSITNGFPQTITNSPATQQSVATTFAADALTVRETCPACPDSVCVGKPDITLHVDSIACLSPGTLAVYANVCNLGAVAPDTGFYLTFYDKNPLVGGAVALQSVFLAEKPAPGVCVQAVVPLGAALLQQAQLFTLVGADGNVPTPISLSGFPFAGGFAECDYANNLDSFEVKNPICAPDSCHPNTFWKIFGRQGNWINISALRAAPDGNLYMAGRKDDRLAICKMAPDGQFLWTRSLALAPLQRMLIAEIIVDSEGMIVGSGNLADVNTSENKDVFAFRYNPTTDQVLWAQRFSAFRSTEGGILEKTPGGNFLLHYNPSVLAIDAKRGEILELDRVTGQIVPAFAKRYEYQYSQAFNNVVTHNGAIYTTGYTIRKVGNIGLRRMVMSKLDASTGDVIWSRTGLTDWPQTSDFIGGDLIVDDNSLIALYYGSETGNAVGNAIKLYLQKTTLDGEVLWVKKYDLAAFPKELVATPDGYVIFAGAITRTFLKTDKEGNLLVSKRLDGQTYFFSSGGIGEQNQAERIGQHLYFAHETARSNVLAGYTTLLKTDLNLEMEFDCAFSPFPITYSSVAVQPNIEAPQIVTASPSVREAVVTALSPDVIVLHKSCPTCATESCTDLPDITARVDSITCSLTDGTIAHLSVCNLGKMTPDTGSYLTFYDKNPLVGPAVALWSIFFADKPAPGACVQMLLPWDAALLQQSQVFTLVGADGNVPTPISLSSFPFSNGYVECNYANNLDSFTTVLPPIQKLDLGPDRSICPGQTVTLDAGNGYATYQWVNGPATQTFAGSTAGNYVAEVTDACGRVQRDTVQVTVLPYPKRMVEVVLLPGDSVTILGKTYFSTTTLMDTIASPTGICDSVVTYNIRLDSLHCPKAASFFKTYEGGLGRVVWPAADGGYYIGGEANKQAALYEKAITKLDAAGKILWTRTFDFLENAVFDALIEDSEGKLVALATSTTGPSSIAVFRYDPAADQVLWIKRMTPPQTDIFAFDLFEKSPGGDYLIAYRLRKNNTELSTEICALHRTTGNLVGGEVWHYEPHAWVNSVALHQNAVYANGLLRDPADPGVTYRYGLMKIDLNTGQPLWARLITAVQPGLDLGSGDVLVDGAGDVVSTVSEPGKAIGLQKTAPNGDLVWLKRLQINESLASNFIPKSIVLLNDGYLISADPLFNGASINALLFVKTNFNGDLVWAKKLSKAGVGYTSGSPNLLAVRAGNGCFIANVIQQGLQFEGMALGQMDADGNLGTGCGLMENVSVTVSNQAATQDPALVVFTTLNRTFAPLVPTSSKATQLLPTTICTKCLPPCEDVAVEKIIQFYPGDTIVIDGKVYTQSGTVVQNFTTPAGCDSVVTNILQLVITEVKITCPNNLTVTLPPNQTSTVVDYSLPTVTTNCPDSTIQLTLLQGLLVGGNFPQGTTQVCYEAANQCGIRDTCCFTITAQQPDLPCDVKTPVGCVRYELLGIQLDALGQRRYRVRMTNTCASPLEFAYIQLPNGVLAVSPQQGATYTAPGGNTYAVRNPNASPFYSVRYKAVTGSLNNGKNDVFEYTLPQQSAPAYIRVAARLADGSHSEAHLNTYNCPEVMENLEFRMENFPRSSSSAQFSILNSPLLVRPNPTDGLLFVDLRPWQGQQVHLRVLNAQGQLVLERGYTVEEEEVGVDLPAGLASGLYYLVVHSDASGQRPSQAAAVRFVLER